MIRKYEHKKEVITQKGVRREKYLTHGGYQVIWFENGDVRQEFPQEKTVYYHFGSRVTQTSYPNGDKVFLFPNGQVEKHLKSGSKETLTIHWNLQSVISEINSL